MVILGNISPTNVNLLQKTILNEIPTFLDPIKLQ